MDNLTIKEIVKISQGKLLPRTVGKDDIFIKGVSFDSRSLKNGDLFVALPTKKCDGHNFVNEAFRRGAAAALVSKNMPGNFLLIKVKDTLAALGRIAQYYRCKFNLTAVGIAGSNGKTTTKEMLAHSLSRQYSIVASLDSFNNFLGVPITMFRITKNTHILICEMETNILGGIKRLCKILNPSIGLISNITSAHLESLKTEVAVCKEKSELLLSLPSWGKAILNIDDRYFLSLKKVSSANKIITFGISQKADFQAKDIKRKGDYFCFKLNDVFVKLKTPFYKNIYNALAAAAVAVGALGLTMKREGYSLSRFKFLPLRSQIIKIGRITIVNDCYNANPQSVKDALLTLKEVSGKRKIALLGDMLELGPKSQEFHREIGRFCGQLSLSGLICVGKLAHFIFLGAKDYGMPKNKIVYSKTYSKVVKLLMDNLKSDDVLLVKGSRLAHLESIIESYRKQLLLTTKI